MREECEFRIQEDFAALLFGLDEGELLDPPWIRRIRLDLADPRYRLVGELHRELQLSFGIPFFFSWSFHRQYTRRELENVHLFTLHATALRPPGEDYGTVFDESTACDICGGGAKQISELKLNLRKIPKTSDLDGTAAGEWVVSDRLAKVFQREKISGIELRPVSHSGRKPDGLGSWYQMIVVSPPVALASQTRLGTGPFDEDAEGSYRCSKHGPGHIAGLNLLSELFVDRSTWSGADVHSTQEWIGCRRGYFRPHPLLIISPRMRSLLLGERVRNLHMEVAHLTESKAIPGSGPPWFGTENDRAQSLARLRTQNTLMKELALEALPCSPIVLTQPVIEVMPSSILLRNTDGDILVQVPVPGGWVESTTHPGFVEAPNNPDILLGIANARKKFQFRAPSAKLPPPSTTSANEFRLMTAYRIQWQLAFGVPFLYTSRKVVDLAGHFATQVEGTFTNNLLGRAFLIHTGTILRGDSVAHAFDAIFYIAPKEQFDVHWPQVQDSLSSIYFSEQSPKQLQS